MRGHGDPPEVARLVDAAADAFEEGDTEAALARAEEALASAPRSVAALHYRAEALAALGRTDDALEAYERALAAGKDDPEVLLGAADLLVNRLPDDARDREDLERALDLARRAGKLVRKGGDAGLAGEAAWLEGAALDQLGRPDEALPRLDDAAGALPDAPEVHLERGIALHELCRWDDAGAALLRAEALDPGDPWIQHHLGLVAERRGDPREARRRLERAQKLDPEAFPAPIALSPRAFDEVVEEAFARLPEKVRRYLENVAVTVEDLPSEEDLRASDPPLSPTILGMFRGPAYGRGGADPWTHLPSAIVLYQRNLERFARSRAELAEEIGVTLVHEVGHFLGLDEDELYARGLD
jgi:predicted Zn-dependent protease with MMP-like domain/thioredoxin-like negative regulator of GroEL